MLRCRTPLTAVDEQPEEFDKTRAMDLIRKQRDELKQAKKAAAELEHYKEIGRGTQAGGNDRVRTLEGRTRQVAE